MTTNDNNTIFLYHDQIGRLDFVQSWGNDLMLVNSARASFGVEKTELDDRDKKLINYLVEHKHTSTLEHCGITFRCVVPLFVRSQHHRHRTWSYNEISRRYTDVNIEFYEPTEFRTQHKSNRQASSSDLINPRLSDEICQKLICLDAADAIRKHHEFSLKLFDELLEKGVCREQARGVLPQNLYTTYYATACLSNIMKFIQLRDKPDAQWEIQVLAKAMMQFVEREFPYAAKAMKNSA